MNNLFSKQHLLLKLLLLISVIFYLFHASFEFIGYLLIAQFIFFLLQPTLIIAWLRTSLKLVPFFIAFFLLGILFDSDFISQLQTATKILILVMVSVYLINTTSLHNFLADIAPIFGKKSAFVLYISATVEFIPAFINNFRQIKSDIFHSALQAITKTAQDSPSIVKKIEAKLAEPLPIRSIANSANFILLFYILLLNLVSWKYL